MMRKEIFRIIDANFNRSREGLRVCEDMARFILNSASLTKELKAVRHDISEILKRTSRGSRVPFLSRDAEGDVGRASKTKSEMARMDAADIFTANMERVKESLRVLEEFFKLIDKTSSIKCAALRFKVYDIEKKAIRRIGPLRNTG